MVCKYVDLSRTITPGIGELPGHPPTTVNEFQTHASHGRSNAHLSYSIHCGTHVDCPYHFFPAGNTVDEIPLDSFIGNGVLVDLQGKVEEGEGISIGKIMENSHICDLNDQQLAQSIILINTGWGAAYETEYYYHRNPYLAEDSAKFFAEKKVKAVGLDFPPDQRGGSTVHRILLGSNVLIIENLINLHLLRDRKFVVMALPIKIFRQSGGPARVVACLSGEDNEC